MADEQSGSKSELIIVDQWGRRKREEPTPITIDDLLPIAKRFEKEIGAFCNDKFKSGAVPAVTVASLIFQRMLVATAQQGFRDFEEGANFIMKVYDGAKRDALKVWED